MTQVSAAKRRSLVFLGEQVAVGAVVKVRLEVPLVKSDCSSRIVGEQEVSKLCTSVPLILSMP